MASVHWFIAWRYLFSRERKALVSVITLIAMAGVAVGVAALLVVIGVMEGMDGLIFGKVAELYPHVRIASQDGRELHLDPQLLKNLRARPDVRLAEPIVEKQAFIRIMRGSEAQPMGIQIIGADRLGKGFIYDIPDTQTGDPITIEQGEILLGAPLSMMLQAMSGSSVVLTATNPIRTALGPVVKELPMGIKGFFSTGFDLFDSATAFVSDQDIRQLFRVPPDKADYIHIKLKDRDRAEAVKHELAAQLGQNYTITTWGEENGEFFGALRLEKLGLFLILLLIILVAAFNIIGTLILMVIEKTREVGILRAVGASQRLIARIFLVDGIMIGLVGTVLGLAIGLGLCLLIPKIPLNVPALIYDLQHVPVKIRPVTVTLITLASMSICTLAALFPARQAAKLNPVEALRYD